MNEFNNQNMNANVNMNQGMNLNMNQNMNQGMNPNMNTNMNMNSVQGGYAGPNIYNGQGMNLNMNQSTNPNINANMNTNSVQGGYEGPNIYNGQGMNLNMNQSMNPNMNVNQGMNQNMNANMNMNSVQGGYAGPNIYNGQGMNPNMIQGRYVRPNVYEGPNMNMIMNGGGQAYDQKKMRKKSSKKILAYSIIGALLALALIVSFPLIRKMEENSKKNKLTTSEEIIKHCGFDESTIRHTEVDGIECDEIFNNGKRETPYDHLHFYVFKNEKDAKRVFAGDIRNYGVIEDAGDDFRMGWLKDVCDASVCEYEYISKNVIVSAEVEISGGWGDINSAGSGTVDYREELIDVIREF